MFQALFCVLTNSILKQSSALGTITIIPVFPTKHGGPELFSDLDNPPMSQAISRNPSTEVRVGWLQRAPPPQPACTEARHV